MRMTVPLRDTEEENLPPVLNSPQIRASPAKSHAPNPPDSELLFHRLRASINWGRVWLKAAEIVKDLAYKNRMALEACVQARKKGRDLAREGKGGFFWSKEGRLIRMAILPANSYHHF